MIRGLNHITIATADLERAASFYSTVLGLTLEKTWSDGAYLSAGSLWLCLSFDKAAQAGQDYSHIAFDLGVNDFDAMATKVRESGAVIWKTNRSEGASLYFCDPDGHRLELHVSGLASRLDDMNKEMQTC